MKIGLWGQNAHEAALPVLTHQRSGCLVTTLPPPPINEPSHERKQVPQFPPSTHPSWLTDARSGASIPRRRRLRNVRGGIRGAREGPRHRPRQVRAPRGPGQLRRGQANSLLLLDCSSEKNHLLFALNCFGPPQINFVSLYSRALLARLDRGRVCN